MSASIQPTASRRRDPAAASRWAVLLLAVGLCMAMPIATWWLVGYQCTTLLPTDEMEYLILPIDLAPNIERAVGIGSVILVAASALLLARAALRGQFDPLWWLVLGLVLVAGAIVGTSWRVLHASVIGADLDGELAVLVTMGGEKLMLLFGGPVVAVLLLSAGIYSLYLLLLRRR